MVATSRFGKPRALRVRSAVKRSTRNCCWAEAFDHEPFGLLVAQAPVFLIRDGGFEVMTDLSEDSAAAKDRQSLSKLS